MIPRLKDIYFKEIQYVIIKTQTKIHLLEKKL